MRFYKETWWKYMDYSNIHRVNQIEDIYFEQKNILMHCIRSHNMFSNIIDYYYESNEDSLKKDYEFSEFYAQFQTKFQEFAPKCDIHTMKKILTDIIFESSVRHSESHTNYFYLYNFYDLPTRKTNTRLILNKINLGEKVSHRDLYSTYGNLYSTIVSTVIQQFH
jgi:hypothetical protein